MSGYIPAPLCGRQRRHFDLIVLSLFLFLAAPAFAGTGAEFLVSPAKPDALANKPLYLSVLTSTELELSRFPAGRDGEPLQDGRISIGSDNHLADTIQIYDIPITATLYPDLYVRLDLPFVSRDVKTASGSTGETGLGDMDLTFKLRMELEEATELFYLFSARIPTGDGDRGLGSGTYDLSIAQKLSTWFGDYRTTFMAGVTVPMSHGTVLGSNIKLNPTISYMAAAERTLFRPGLWFGLKAAGQHIFNSRVNDVYQANDLTTLDIIPEVKFHPARGLEVRAALLLPAYTAYGLPGAGNSRGVVLSLGIAKAF